MRRAIDEVRADLIKGYVDKIKANMQNSLIKDEKTLNEALEYIGKISGYSFNRSHSCGYSYVAFWTMYLKAHYPLEFGLSTINNRMDVHEIIRDFQQLWKTKCGVELVPIDINKSKPKCTYYPDEKKVYAGFLMLRGIGGSFADKLIKKQPFKSLEHFADSLFSKVGFEIMIKIGALDNLQQQDFGYVNRKELFYLLFAYQYKIDYKKIKKNMENDDFFKLPRIKTRTFEDVHNAVKALQLEEYTEKEKQKFEKEYYEFLIFSSAMKDIQHLKEKYEKATGSKIIPFKALLEDSKYEKKIVKLLGNVEFIEEKTSKNGNIFYWITLDDGNDKVRCLVWKKVFDDNAAKFKEGKRVLIVASRSTWKEKYVSFPIENRYEAHSVVMSMKQLENFVLKE